jgi:hypothetical protein
MTGSAILSIYDFQHVYLAASRLEWKTNVTVAGLAGIANTMKPVGKNNRTNTALVRIIIEDDITIFSLAFATVKYSCEQGYAQGKTN